ncbi:CinA family protein [Sphingopyxis sp. KK2]|uniref:CinA family protein n=1 Tax=Sphingopyxis sp. KK2 TaxID=1855727 RepID=UPI0009F96FF8|nr:nicotinamide-nucleotide amidohydrolase family protein [Sphingopyxis sp. KK2]
MSAATLIEHRSRKLARHLAGKTLRFVTAESCTGGQLAAIFAADSALGPHLERGFVAYSIDAKCEMLGVARDVAEQCDGVSSEVAAAMATGALRKSQADIALAITGFCGPREGREEVGLVYIGVAGTDVVRVEDFHFGDIGRRHVLDQAVAAALQIMIETAS